MKAAIYARVSTKDKQEVENQLNDLRQYCHKSGWNIFREYIDHETGGSPNRENFKEMFRDAHQKKFDVVLFWALDRFSREGARETINYMYTLETYGVSFSSFTEPYLNSIGIFKEAIISILATLAKQEKIRISERVKAGISTARAKGKRIGRNPVTPVEREGIIEIYEKSKELSFREIALRSKQKLTTVYRTIRMYKEGKIDCDGCHVPNG